MRSLGVITIPAGTSRSNSSTGAATLDCGTLAAGNLNTKLKATAGGTGGNAITVSLTGDSSSGVTITVTGNAVAIHYKSAVSTVADVEAAIAALSTSTVAGLIAVDVPGTGATVLTAAGDNFTAHNLTGGAAGAFAIPQYAPALYLLTPSASVYYKALPNPSSPSPLAASSSDFPLTANVGFPETISLRAGAPYYVAAYNGGGSSATLQVFTVGE